MKGRKPAIRGYRYEQIFVNLVNSNKSFNSRLKKIVGESGELRAKEVEDRRRKADAELFVSGHIYGCSIKTSEIDFSQLDRRWLRDLAKPLRMPEDVVNALEECISNKRINKRSKFIMDKHQPLILEYFSKNIRPLLNELFLREDLNLRYFIVCVYLKNAWYIIKMRDMLDFISRQPLWVTRKGILYFGDCLRLQKKGGDGKRVRVPKSDPSHPGNQLQFKIRPLSLLRNMEKNKVFQI